MKAFATFLLVLSYLADCHGWTCKEAPQQYPAAQLDAGQGNVVMTDRLSNAFFLSGSDWLKLGSVALKHVSAGPAGIWGVDDLKRVYKYVSGDFINVNGLDLNQVDAGGEVQIVGVTTTDTIHCLKSDIASLYKQIGVVSWTEIPGRLKYFSCGPNGCWGVNSADQIYFTKMTPSTCNIGGWINVPGGAVMAEVGTDGSVFVVNAEGQVYQRAGITDQLPQGTSWINIPLCLSIKHASYDLGVLWLVSKGGFILQCVQ